MALYCSGHVGVVSVMFYIDDTYTGDFFDWIPNAQAGNEVTIDVGKILTQITGVTNTVSGYRGSDTMPNCSNPVCWYVVNEAFPITTEQLAFFQAQGANNRSVDINTATVLEYWNAGPFSNYVGAP